MDPKIAYECHECHRIIEPDVKYAWRYQYFTTKDGLEVRIIEFAICTGCVRKEAEQKGVRK